MNNKKKEVLVITVLLIIQTIMYVIAGVNKQYIHIDEAYSFGLASYDKPEIENNEDFYNTWHTKEYYEDYLTVNKDEISNYKQVYENQKNDVHPPLYYLILRFAMGFSVDHFSKWTGIIVNIIIYYFVTIFMYLILKQLFKGENREKEKALILSFLSSITIASVSNVIYIRMYSLLTLEILITIFLHIKLLQTKKTNIKLLLAIGLCVLAGILTHYYYLFYIGILYLIFFIKYIKESNIKDSNIKDSNIKEINIKDSRIKNYVNNSNTDKTLYMSKIKMLASYTLTILTSGILSLIIFPYSIQHMFFGYRGQGVISNLENIYKSILNIFEQLHNLNYYGFNNLLFVIVIIIIGILIYKKNICNKNLQFDTKKFNNNCNNNQQSDAKESCYNYNKKESKNIINISKENKEILKLIYIPSIFFFIITSIASPWNVLRYIVPVCGLIFVFLMYLLYKLINSVTTEKISNILCTILICLILVSPIVLKMRPELLYYDEKETIQKVENELNVPTIYLYNKQTSNFLDNIMIFSMLKDSYIVKDIEYTKENIQNILNNINISKGIIIFINEPQKEEILNIVKQSKNFENCEYINKLNATEIYYIY